MTIRGCSFGRLVRDFPAVQIGHSLRSMLRPDWESIEDYTVFRGSKDYVEVEGDLGQLFDLDAATPVTRTALANANSSQLTIGQYC